MMVIGDINKVINSIWRFNTLYIPVLLILVLLNYLLRTVKWHYFFKVLHFDISFRENLYVYFSGLLMAITPGKIGEIWKSWIIKDIRGYGIPKTIPIVFMDRITDIIAMLTLVSIGLFFFNVDIQSFIIVALFFVLMILLLKSELLVLKVCSFSSKFDKIKEAYLASIGLLCWKPFFISLIISILAWFMECLALYYTYKGLCVNANLFESTFIYAISSIAGALTMMPGGLGVTEASIAGFSNQILNMDTSMSIAATFIIRAATLWFAVVIGAITYFFGRRLLLQKLV